MEKQQTTEVDQDINVLHQIREEFEVCKQYIQEKREQWKIRMRLYNNQKKNPTATGDPLLFTIMQTNLAALYDNKLSVRFLGREHGDELIGHNVTAMAKYDYDAMSKDSLDYEWEWDGLFYGKGLVLMQEFDKDKMRPVPHLIDIMTFFHDPQAISMDGREGRGGCRFWGREIQATKYELEQHGGFKNLDMLGALDATDYEVEEAHRARSQSQGTNDISNRSEITGGNRLHTLLEWYTIHEGKKKVFVIANDKTTIVRERELKDQTSWGVIERQIYPMPGSFWGTSIPDLVEDKQRLRAKVMNIAQKGVEFSVYPQYLYDNGVVTNVSELMRPAANKFIGIDGDPRGSVVPLPRDQVKQDVQWMMDLVNYNAEKATGTPAIQQGATPDTARTATERSLQKQAVDKRYSLAAKIFSSSEKSFWRHWYKLYMEHFSIADKKLLRIAGGLGYEYRKLSKSDLSMGADPDIQVEDSVVSESERMNRLQSLSNSVQIIAQNPNVNRDFLDRKLAQLNGLRPEEIALLIPPTSEELRALEENILLNDNKIAKIKMTDDHMKHIEVHSRAAETNAQKAHIKGHFKMMQEAIGKKNDLPITDGGVAGVPQDQQPQLGSGPTPANQQTQDQISPTRLNFNDVNQQ